MLPVFPDQALVAGRPMDVVTAPAPVLLTPQPSPQAQLQPGAVINALVLKLLDQGQVRLAVANTLLDVMSHVPLVPGQTVRLAVEGTPADLRLVLVEPGANAVSEATVRPGAGSEPQVREVRAPTSVADPSPAPSTNAKSPEAVALTQAVRNAAARQNGLSPLMADVAAAAELEMLPAPVRAAAQQVLALRTPLRPDLTANDIKQAFARSGLFLEARLAASAPSEPMPDLKAALSVLRQALGSWLEAAAPAGKAVASSGAPPAARETATADGTPVPAKAP